MPTPVVLGIDSGTQSTKVLAVHTETGEVVATGRGAHTGEDIQHPNEWWNALRDAVRQVLASDVEVQGLSVSGQQHGCVLIDPRGDVVRPAPLWNNVASAPDAERLNGLADFAAETGSRLVASYTITKLAHIARTAPEDITRATAVGLPHDWLNFRLTGQLTTDRGDASGTGWWSPKNGAYRRDLLALAIGEEDATRITLPEVRGADEPSGTLSREAAVDLGLPAGIPVGPGTGDNMAAALGVGAASGEIVVSLGTSGTAFAVSDAPTADPSGEVAGFADATGHFLPLACMLNCTRVVDTTARLVGLGRDEALGSAGDLPPGADGILMLPYLSGERTPNLPACDRHDRGSHRRQRHPGPAGAGGAGRRGGRSRLLCRRARRSRHHRPGRDYRRRRRNPPDVAAGRGGRDQSPGAGALRGRACGTGRGRAGIGSCPWATCRGGRGAVAAGGGRGGARACRAARRVPAGSPARDDPGARRGVTLTEREGGGNPVEQTTHVSVLDTDIGTDVDDILALTLMARTPEYNLAGVTTVYGNTALRARMARYVLRQLGRDDVIVAAGSSETLAGEPVWWGGHEGDGIPGLEEVEVDESRDGVALLCGLAREHPGRLDVFAIGPLTNIAMAIQADSAFAGSVRHLYIMGGAYWGDQPEHNIKSDAPAADVVFSSGIPITVCGLDVTTRVWLREDGVEEIREGLGAFGEVLAQQFWRWLDFMVEHGISDGKIKGTHMHDPLAVLAAIEPGVLTFERCDVTVDLEGDSIGRTRLEHCGSGRIRVASDVDVAAAERALLDRIAGPRQPDQAPGSVRDTRTTSKGTGE